MYDKINRYITSVTQQQYKPIQCMTNGMNQFRIDVGDESRIRSNDY